MIVIHARNVHQALPLGLDLLFREGQTRSSRNGNVEVTPWPVTTVYTRPCERIAHWPQRDWNVAFTLYEALWMLQGRDDVAPLLRYVKDFNQFSDDGERLHGAYGYRWRHLGSAITENDQLSVIADRLRENPDDRRCVLQMWNAHTDLGSTSKDVPCNDMATFQRNHEGALDLTVFCRSNDILWGCYFANAFHFSVLLEYMAARIGCPVGTYRQVSVNWHGYSERIEAYRELRDEALTRVYSVPAPIDDPYVSGLMRATPMLEGFGPSLPGDSYNFDAIIDDVMASVDSGFQRAPSPTTMNLWPWFKTAWLVLYAHHHYRTDKSRDPRDVLALAPHRDDQMVVAMNRWLTRRINVAREGAVR